MGLGLGLGLGLELGLGLGLGLGCREGAVPQRAQQYAATGEAEAKPARLRPLLEIRLDAVRARARAGLGLGPGLGPGSGRGLELVLGLGPGLRPGLGLGLGLGSAASIASTPRGLKSTTLFTRPSVSPSISTIWYRRDTVLEPETRFWIGDGPSPDR